jgi:two-component system phosphate regulon response regulator PhoB
MVASYGAFRRVVVGSTRIVLIEEGPLIERLVSLFERNGTDATAAAPSGDRVCEAHILTPNLILLDLSRAAAQDGKGARAPREGMNAADAAIFKLAIAKSGADHDGVEVLSADGPHSDRLQPNERLLAHERLLPHLLREELVASTEPAPDASGVPDEPVLQMGPVRIDRHGHWAYLHEKKLHLTPTEFRLLECFLREPGRAFTRSQLLDVSIGNASFVLERTIDVHIRSLRAKLGSARELIETVRGVGYRFREIPDLSSAN